MHVGSVILVMEYLDWEPCLHHRLNSGSHLHFSTSLSVSSTLKTFHLGLCGWMFAGPVRGTVWSQVTAERWPNSAMQPVQCREWLKSAGWERKKDVRISPPGMKDAAVGVSRPCTRCVWYQVVQFLSWRTSRCHCWECSAQALQPPSKGQLAFCSLISVPLPPTVHWE